MSKESNLENVLTGSKFKRHFEITKEVEKEMIEYKLYKQTCGCTIFWNFTVLSFFFVNKVSILFILINYLLFNK